MQAKAQPEAQLGDSEAKAMSLGEGRLWRESTGRDIPPTIHTISDGGGFAGVVVENLVGAICRKGDPWCGPPFGNGIIL